MDSSAANSWTLSWIHDERRLDPGRFGWKAANLSAWDLARDRTPEGFAISFDSVTRIANGTAGKVELDHLKTAWERLISNGRKVLVRSSSTIEHAQLNSFAGLFVTTPDVTGFEEVIEAIRRAHASSHSTHVESYAALRGTAVPQEHMAVLVQHQIGVRYAALIQVTASGYVIEAYAGDISRRIRGENLPEHVVIIQNGHTSVPRSSRQFPRRFLKDLGDVARDVRDAIEANPMSVECLLEVATDGEKLHVLQLNLIRQNDILSVAGASLNLDVTGTALESDAGTLGLKAAAMAYFQRRRLFTLPLWIFPPYTPIETILRRLSASDRIDTGYTVRFSDRGVLGLPRAFQANVGSVVKWLEDVREERWTTIVHSHIAVRSSFELSLSGNRCLLEHVPGIWESDNSLDPDVIMIEDTRVEAWVVTHVRAARHDSPRGVSTENATPLTNARVRHWSEHVSAIVPILRTDFAAALPLSVHFVEDSGGRWHFLNLRKGFAFEKRAMDLSEAEPCIVRAASDVDRWDRRSPILLRFTADRGSEHRVLAIAERLRPYRKTPLLIDFGILSHPALILRELGFTLVPRYLAGRQIMSPSYQLRSWSIDVGADAIDRIKKEPFLYCDATIRVVHDREPIVPGHLLVVAEQEVRSFAESSPLPSLIRMQEHIETNRGVPPRPWLFLERGRASFCTSGFTSVHAHAHVIPERAFTKGILKEFADHLGAEEYATLGEALAAARESHGEYTLAAKWQGPAYLCVLPDNASIAKRQIRQFFGARVLP